MLTPGTSAVCHAVVLSGSSRKTYRETDGLPNRSRHHKIHSECRMHLVNIITNSPVLTGDKLTHLTQLKMFLQLVCFYPSHESELRFSLSLHLPPRHSPSLFLTHTHTHTLFETMSQQGQMEGTVPHAEPSFCHSLSLTTPHQTCLDQITPDQAYHIIFNYGKMLLSLSLIKLLYIFIKIQKAHICIRKLYDTLQTGNSTPGISTSDGVYLTMSR